MRGGREEGRMVKWGNKSQWVSGSFPHLNCRGSLQLGSEVDRLINYSKTVYQVHVTWLSCSCCLWDTILPPTCLSENVLCQLHGGQTMVVWADPRAKTQKSRLDQINSNGRMDHGWCNKTVVVGRNWSFSQKRGRGALKRLRQKRVSQSVSSQFLFLLWRRICHRRKIGDRGRFGHFGVKS